MVLIGAFGFENVSNHGDMPNLSSLAADTALVIGDGVVLPGLREFLDQIGTRSVVLDVGAFVRMAVRDGFSVSVAGIDSEAIQPLQVFQHRMSAEVFPGAPAVVVGNAGAFSCGFADGDRFHLFHRDGRRLLLQALVEDAEFRKMSEVLDDRCTVWARTISGNCPAVLILKNRIGGHVVVFDLDTVNRLPEPSGAESLPVHLLLSALGKTRVTFGKFVTACRRYEEMLDGVGRIHRQYPEFTRLDPVGRSRDGRELFLLSVAFDFKAPSILFTTGIHPLEWAPAYGVVRFLLHLLEQCRTGTDYAKAMLDGKRLQWLVSACPDGWEARDLKPPGLDLNRNFPGSWERCVPGETYWDAYNRKFSTAGDEQLTSRGPAPGSQPETRTMMKLLESGVVSLVDFHETTAFDSFFHPPEMANGTVPDLDRHIRLNFGMARQFNGRFFANGNAVAFRPALNDFASYSFREARHLEQIVPGPHCGWMMYAAEKGIPATLVEAAGADCTHYQTIRRTEYAATAAEQILGQDGGSFIRNSTTEPCVCAASVKGLRGNIDIRICDENGIQSDRRTVKVASGETIVETLSPSWTLFVRQV
jgi:hypothetical protein